MIMVKVTQKLRETWANQKAQSLEERTHTQDGTPRSEEDIAIVDWEIEVMDRLLSLPLGTKFNGQDIQQQMLAEKGLTAD